jgi:hypothetical protein
VQSWLLASGKQSQTYGDSALINALPKFKGSAMIYASLLIAAGAFYFWLDPKVTNTKRSDFMNTLKNN